jgi:2,3-bisphosphoglycerate-independent phosphoglycerate mutase
MNKVGLIILDGWGIGDQSKSDAIFHANTPTMDKLMSEYAHAELIACGESVGLPEGQMGNSEVGHLNIGAGRIVYQELTRINKAIQNGSFFENSKLRNAFDKAVKTNQKVHLIGLVSEGGVHSSQKHLHALCDLAMEYKLKNVFIHAFLDGRDCDPKSGLGCIKALEKHIKSSEIQIASLIGRYYAMDRDNRWERIKLAYDLLVNGNGDEFSNAVDGINSSYQNNITDEFIRPIVIGNENNSATVIEDGDLVICFNFRTDRPREIIKALSQEDLVTFGMKKLSIDVLTMTSYDDTFSGIEVIFEKDNLSDTLGEVISKNKKTQIRIAETEKYPHVTFFFSGGREVEFKGERRLLVNSPKVATYDLQPEMSAQKVTDTIIEAIKESKPDFFCLNFANPDMVGHTGVYDAIVKAVEKVDYCLNEVIQNGLALGYEFIVIADHGNADFVLNADGSPNTAHSLNQVPIIFVSDKSKLQLSNGILADVAPTILERLEIDKPEIMTGRSLFVDNSNENI